MQNEGLLREALQSLLDESSRINDFKAERYWYPLSLATYGVDEVMAAVEALCSFRTTMWRKTEEFEHRFARHAGSSEAIMVNSGSSADLLIAYAMTNPALHYLQPGDEILVPSTTWPTQIWSVMMAGLRPVFVDTDRTTLNMDLEDLERKIDSKTKGIFVVHLMGNPCDMHTISKLCEDHHLVLLEDCCEADGARFAGRSVGTFGMASSYSFFFSHHITTMEGGMVCCDDPRLSDLFRVLRAHGWSRNTRYTSVSSDWQLDPRYTFLNWGFNCRPTEIQAAWGLEQLDRATGFLSQRVQNAETLQQALSSRTQHLVTLEVHPDAECSWFAFPLIVAEDAPFTRSELTGWLEMQGVETRPIVGGSLMRHPVREVFPEIQGWTLPGTEWIHDNAFYVGIYPLESPERLERLIDCFDTFFKSTE